MSVFRCLVTDYLCQDILGYFSRFVTNYLWQDILCYILKFSNIVLPDSFRLLHFLLFVYELL